MLGAPVPAGPSPFRFTGTDSLSEASIAPDGRSVSFRYDGTSPAAFRVSYDGVRPGVLSMIAVAPAEEPLDTPSVSP